MMGVLQLLFPPPEHPNSSSSNKKRADDREGPGPPLHSLVWRLPLLCFRVAMPAWQPAGNMMAPAHQLTMSGSEKMVVVASTTMMLHTTKGD